MNHTKTSTLGIAIAIAALATILAVGLIAVNALQQHSAYAQGGNTIAQKNKISQEQKAEPNAKVEITQSAASSGNGNAAASNTGSGTSTASSSQGNSNTGSQGNNACSG